MVLAGDHLIFAGPPDVVDADAPTGSFEGRLGGLLWVVSAESGKKVAEYPLDSPPVFDGMSTTGERLYLALRDGSTLCLSGSR